MHGEAAPKVSLVSLGCPKALVDSARIATRLRAEGYELSRDHKGDEANELFRGKAQEIYIKAAAKMADLVEVNAKTAIAATEAGQEHYAFSRKLIIATIAAGAIISLMLAWLIVRSVSRPVTLMTGGAGWKVSPALDIPHELIDSLIFDGLLALQAHRLAL